MDLDAYDEYGNYIGGKEIADAASAAEESESDASSDGFTSASSQESTDFDTASEPEEHEAPTAPNTMALTTVQPTTDQLIPSDVAFYGKDVEMVVATEDNQQITKPLLFDPSTTVTRYFAGENSSVQRFRSNGPCITPEKGAFMRSIVQELPERMRTVAVVGHLHHGKTSLCDSFLAGRAADGKHVPELTPGSPHRLLDTRRLEFDKCMSMVSHPFSCIAQSFSSPSARSSTRRHFSYVLNAIDTPGHANFEDEALAGLAAADGALLVVDVAEGTRAGTFRALDAVFQQNIPFVLVLNKVDRLVLELHLPPADAYLKMLHIVHEVNEYVSSHCYSSLVRRVDPCDGSVVFGSSKQRWFFSLESFAGLYERRGQTSQSALGTSLASRLWGPWRYNASNGTIQQSNASAVFSDHTDPFTFVVFVLEPIYKICTAILSNESSELNRILKLSPALSPKEQSLTMPELFPLCIDRFLNPSGTGVVGSNNDVVATAILQHIDAAAKHNDKGIFARVPAPSGVTIATIVKFLQFPIQRRLRWDESSSSPAYEADLFYPLVRILRGKLKVGMTGHLMGAESLADLSLHNAMQLKSLGLDEMYLIDPLQGLIHTDSACEGSLVTLRGFTEAELRAVFPFTKEGLLVAHDNESSPDTDSVSYPMQHLVYPFLPSQRLRRNQCVVKVGVEPVSSAIDYGNFLYAVRCAEYAHPALTNIREETGERMLLTLGELRLDTILFELREVFGRSARENSHGSGFETQHDTEVHREVGNLQIRVSDPFVCFTETISQESERETRKEVQMFGVQGKQETSDRKNREWIAFTAEPLSNDMQNDFAAGAFFDVERDKGAGAVVCLLGVRHGWDALARKGFWGFGPHPSYGPNALINETSLRDAESSSSSEYDDSSDDNSSDSEESATSESHVNFPVDALREGFLEGFCWGMSEGPLCGEPVRGVSMRLAHASFPGVDPQDASQMGTLRRSLVPATRQCVAQCVLRSDPCLLEPMFTLDIESTHAGRSVVYALISKRRGKVMSEERRPGSVFYTISAEVPVLDSFGLEVDLRVESAGEVFAESRFSGWDVLPGGPATEVLQDIERHPSYSLASADVDIEPVPPRKLTEDVILKIRRRKGMFAEYDVG